MTGNREGGCDGEWGAAGGWSASVVILCLVLHPPAGWDRNLREGRGAIGCIVGLGVVEWRQNGSWRGGRSAHGALVVG